jgi:hypothetical protein
MADEARASPPSARYGESSSVTAYRELTGPFVIARALGPAQREYRRGPRAAVPSRAVRSAEREHFVGAAGASSHPCCKRLHERQLVVRLGSRRSRATGRSSRVPARSSTAPRTRRRAPCACTSRARRSRSHPAGERARRQYCPLPALPRNVFLERQLDLQAELHFVRPASAADGGGRSFVAHPAREEPPDGAVIVAATRNRATFPGATLPGLRRRPRYADGRAN